MENSEFKPVKLRLKIDLVSYPARAEGLVNMITTRNLLIIEIQTLFATMLIFTMLQHEWFCSDHLDSPITDERGVSFQL